MICWATLAMSKAIGNILAAEWIESMTDALYRPGLEGIIAGETAVSNNCRRFGVTAAKISRRTGRVCQRSKKSLIWLGCMVNCPSGRD